MRGGTPMAKARIVWTGAAMIEPLNLRTVGASFADAFLDEDEHAFDGAAYRSWLREHRSALGTFGNYVPGKLHDSRVMSLHVSDAAVQMVLNDFATRQFAHALVETKQLPIATNRLVFPLELEFKTSQRALLHFVGEDGELVAADTLRVDEYLYEHVAVAGDAHSIGFCLWQAGEADARGQYVVLLASVTEIVATEQQASAWHAIFGSAYEHYYRHFKRAFDDDRFVFGHAECLQLVADCDSAMA